MPLYRNISGIALRVSTTTGFKKVSKNGTINLTVDEANVIGSGLQLIPTVAPKVVEPVKAEKPVEVIEPVKVEKPKQKKKKSTPKKKVVIVEEPKEEEKPVIDESPSDDELVD
jgi:hypothetical protein